MSLPTVTQNLKELEAAGLVERKGLYESTGGRKAHIYHFVADAHIAVGMVLLKDLYRIVAVDLYGEELKSEEVSHPFSCDDEYFLQMGGHVNALIAALGCDNSRILGVCIALQGLISPDQTTVAYGEILSCTGLTLDRVAAGIPYPCTLIHDTDAAAAAELWARKDLTDAVLLSLTKNFGGAVITGGQVHHGLELASGIIEHMRLYPHGRLCYCGKQGCIEAYCSAGALKRDAGEPLETFFEGLRAGDSARQEIWQTYLHNLAIAINNIRMVFDSEFIIGGYLLRFMTDEDFNQLTQYAPVSYTHLENLIRQDISHPIPVILAHFRPLRSHQHRVLEAHGHGQEMLHLHFHQILRRFFRQLLCKMSSHGILQRKQPLLHGKAHRHGRDGFGAGPDIQPPGRSPVIGRGQLVVLPHADII